MERREFEDRSAKTGGAGPRWWWISRRTDVRIPVSSASSRRAAVGKVSPGSTPPPGISQYPGSESSLARRRTRMDASATTPTFTICIVLEPAMASVQAWRSLTASAEAWTSGEAGVTSKFRVIWTGVPQLPHATRCGSPAET